MDDETVYMPVSSRTTNITSSMWTFITVRSGYTAELPELPPPWPGPGEADEVGWMDRTRLPGLFQENIWTWTVSRVKVVFVRPTCPPSSTFLRSLSRSLRSITGFPPVIQSVTTVRELSQSTCTQSTCAGCEDAVRWYSLSLSLFIRKNVSLMWILSCFFLFCNSRLKRKTRHLRSTSVACGNTDEHIVTFYRPNMSSIDRLVDKNN